MQIIINLKHPRPLQLWFFYNCKNAKNLSETQEEIDKILTDFAVKLSYNFSNDESKISINKTLKESDFLENDLVNNYKSIDLIFNYSTDDKAIEFKIKFYHNHFDDAFVTNTSQRTKTIFIDKQTYDILEKINN